MRVLVTGAFGNIGQSTVEALIEQGHTVRCLDLKTRHNARAARKLSGRAEILWGDLRRPGDVAAAVRGQDVVIHLAFIIPKLSVTGFESEDYPDWAREVNVGGTRSLIDLMKAQPTHPRLLFASSYHVYGRTQDQPPPRTASDPVQPLEHYAHHKVQAEELVRSSGLEWAILRLAAAFPIALRLDPCMFDIPLENRMEYVHTRDVGLAFANAVSSPEVWGKILLIGGGPRCQHTYGEITELVLEGMGVGMLPKDAFGTIPFATDWLDTSESQRLLHYQHHALADYVEDMKAQLRVRRHLIRVFRPLVRHVLLRQSAYYLGGQPGWLTIIMQGFKMLKRKPVRVNTG